VLQIALLCTLAVSLTTAVAFLILYRFGGGIEWVRALPHSVWLGTAALTVTTAAGLVVFSVLRGFGHPRFANLHQLTTLTAVLAVGVTVRGAGVDQLLMACAASGAAVNVVCLVWILHRHCRPWSVPRWGELRAAASQVFGYSIFRIGDGPLQASLSLVGVVAAPAIGGLTLAGYIHISQTIVRITEMVVVPLSVIFLPVVARHVREGRHDALRGQAQLVYDSIVLIGACGVTHGIAWGQPVLNAAFGTQYSSALPYLLCTLPSILPFLLFAGFRSFIDGYSTRPANTLHLLAAAGFIVVATRIWGAAFDGLGLCVAYTCGVTLLGALTVRFARRHFGLRPVSRATALAAGFAVAGGAAAWGIAREMHGAPAFAVFVVFAGVELALAAGTVWVAWRSRHPVAVFAFQRLRDRSRPARTESGQPLSGSDPAPAGVSTDAARAATPRQAPDGVGV